MYLIIECVNITCRLIVCLIGVHYRFNGLVILLVETHGASVDALSLAKKTPLHMAAETGQMEVCNTLLKMNADANATDEVELCYIFLCCVG